ncbi:unnamed protein product [Parajaminaea phylloscopi]
MGHGAGHTTDEDIFSSPESSTYSQAHSASSASTFALRSNVDPRIGAGMRLTVANASSSASESGTNYDTDFGSTDLSGSSPSGTETSATSVASSAPRRQHTIRKQASQPTMSLRSTAAPTAAQSYAVGPTVPTAGPSLPRSQSSTSLSASGASLGRASEIRPGSRHASLRAGRSVSRGRVASHGKTQSWDGGPIPVLHGRGPRSETSTNDRSPTPSERGMVPDGFGGYIVSDSGTSAPSSVDGDSRPSPIEESSPDLPPSQRAEEPSEYASSAREYVAPLRINRGPRNDSVAESQASASSHSSYSSYTSGGHPQRALRVGSYYDAEGRESVAAASVCREDSRPLSSAEQHSSTADALNRSRANSMPSASMMRDPSRSRLHEGQSNLEAHRNSVPAVLGASASSQSDEVRMRSTRGFHGLQGAEHGGAMVSLSQYGPEFETGEHIVPDRMSQADQESILDSVRVEVQADRACRQTANTRSALTEELSGNALPNGKKLSHSRSAMKLGLSRSMSEGPGVDLASNSNLERHGTLINPSANPARRSRDLQRLLGDSRRKAPSATASDSEKSTRPRSPVKGGNSGLQRSNAVGSNTAPPAILEQGRRKEARVDVDVMLESDLVVEGGMLRGRLEVKIRKPSEGEGAVYLAQPKVRVVGFEELIGGEDSRHIFFHHACLVHGEASQPGASQSFVLHGSPTLSSPEATGCSPLPCFSSTPDSEGYSAGREGVHSIPFNLEVPIGKGAKGSYRGKHAHVRYIVIGSIKLKDAQGGNRSIAHFYRHVELFPYLNPAIVLSSAPRALQAAGEKGLFLGGSGKVRVVASLHRGTWVAGQRVYVNVAVQNGTSKRINSASLTLIRTVTLFRPRPEFNVHGNTSSDLDADACTTSTTRKKVTEEILEMGQKGSRGFVTAKGWWTGVEAQSNLDFSHHLAIPSDALTIARGRHVEISYHVRVAIGSSLSADVCVELPLRIVNFMSLDPPPLKHRGTTAAPRTWTTTSTTTRNSVTSDEGIALVKSADALRSPGRVEIGRGEPNLPSQGPSHLLALSQRAAMRRGDQTLQAPEDPARRLQHQKSLDFINHAIRSATARRNSNQKANEDGCMPMGLGIDVPDGAESSSGETLETDADATPTGSTVSTFSGSEGHGRTRRHSRQAGVHPSCMPYEHIDVPAPSFGFPFVQLPAVSVDDIGDDSDDDETGDRTLDLNDDSVAEVDMVVGSARLDGDAFQRLPQHDGDESVDPDASVETIRAEEEDSDEPQSGSRASSDDGEPGEELARPHSDGSRPMVVIETSSPERPVQAAKAHRRQSTVVEAHRQSVAGPRATLTAGDRQSKSASAPRNSAASGGPAVKLSSENLRKQSSVSSLRSSTSSTSTASSNKGTTSAAAGGPRPLPASKDVPSPAKPALKAKSSFTFATSDAPLRIAKAGSSVLPANAAKAVKGAKVAPEQLTAKPVRRGAETSSRKSRPLPQEPTAAAVDAAAKSDLLNKYLVSPAKSDRSLTSGGEEDLMTDSSPSSAHEALTPESGHGQDALDGTFSEGHIYAADEDQFAGDSNNGMHGLGLVLEEDVQATGKTLLKAKVASGRTTLAPAAAQSRARREASAEPPSANTVPRILRHSNSTASLTGERLQRSHSNASSASMMSRAGTAGGSTATTTNIRGTNVTVPSVRNKIAMLESRQQALRDFTRPASGTWAGQTGSSSPSSSTPPRRASRALVAPASEPRTLAHKTSRSSLAPRELSRQTSKASIALSEASTMTTSSSSSALQEWMRRDSIASNASFKAPMLRRAG